MSYGVEVIAPDGDVTFRLTTRLTALYYTATIPANSSGSVYLPVPHNMSVAIQAVPTYSDSDLRHIGHRVWYNFSNKRVYWTPGYDGSGDFSELSIAGRPARVSSRVMVFAYVPE